MAPTGSIRQLSDSTFVWELQGFYQLVRRQDLGVHSPDFMYQGTTWDVAMYKTAKDAVHFTNFSLWRKSYTVLRPRLQVTYRLYIKDHRGKQYWWSAVVSNEFDFEKREGTPQALRDVDMLGYIYWNTSSDVFSLYVTFDSAETSLVKRTGSLRLPRKRSFINILKRRGSFTQFGNDQSEDGVKSSEAEDVAESKGRSHSANFSSTDEHQKSGKKGSFLSELKRRGSWLSVAVPDSYDRKDDTNSSASEPSKVSLSSGNNLENKLTAENHKTSPQQEPPMHDSLLLSFETVYKKQESGPEQKQNSAEVGDKRKKNELAEKADVAFTDTFMPSTSSEIGTSMNMEAILMKINSLNVDSSATFHTKLSSQNSSVTPYNLDAASLTNSINSDSSVFTTNFLENQSPPSRRLDSPINEVRLHLSPNIHSTNSPKDRISVTQSASTSEFDFLKKTERSSFSNNQTEATMKDNLPRVVEFNKYPDAATIQQLDDCQKSNWPFNSSVDLSTTTQPSDLFEFTPASRIENSSDSPVTPPISDAASACEENSTKPSQSPSRKLDDVTLSVKGVKIKTRREVLTSKSPVLRSMLQNQTGPSVVIETPNVDAYVFQEFIQYLSTRDSTVLEKDNVADLYRVARQYEVKDLQEKCRDYMAKSVDKGVFCDYLAVALAYPESDLTGEMNEFFAVNMADVILSRQWKKFLVENPVEANQLLVNAVAAKKISSLTARLASRSRQNQTDSFV